MDYFVNQGDDHIVDRVVFTNIEGYVEGVAKDGNRTIAVFDASNRRVFFYINDIDNLIAALTKAKELWGETK